MTHANNSRVVDASNLIRQNDFCSLIVIVVLFPRPMKSRNKKNEKNPKIEICKTGYISTKHLSNSYNSPGANAWAPGGMIPYNIYYSLWSWNMGTTSYLAGCNTGPFGIERGF